MTRNGWGSRLLCWLGWYCPMPETASEAEQARVRAWQARMERRVVYLETEVDALRQAAGLPATHYEPPEPRAHE